MEAVGILRELAREAPDHPGVHRYIIHGWEGSTFANEAWPSCKRYAELTTNIPHALHMPGHIYAQTGRYADAIKSFDDAAVNERGWMAADTLHGNGHHAHNVHFLATSYSFSGQYDKALASARELLAITENPREAAQVDNIYSAYRQGWIAMMRTLVQGERWDAILDPGTLAATGKARLEAWRAWAVGLAHSAKGDVEAARRDAASMDTAMEEFKTKVRLDAPEELRVAREELDAHIAAAAGKTRKALKIFKSAGKKEAALRYSEPPYYPRPVMEAMGGTALRLGKLDQAAEAFREALERHPGSFRSTEGLREIGARSSRSVATGL
jgi:tetratricopeptide (TPR) repeat protein